jgi:hypothetical protein
MTEEEENPNEETEYKQFTSSAFNKALAILFVLALYLVIFMKILFLH